MSTQQPSRPELVQNAFNRIKQLKESGSNYTQIAHLLRRDGVLHPDGHTWGQANTSHFMIENGFRINAKQRRKGKIKKTNLSSEKAREMVNKRWGKVEKPSMKSTTREFIEVLDSNLSAEMKKKLLTQLISQLL